MANNRPSSKARRESIEGPLAQWLNDQGYISCEMAIEAATDALHKGEPEVAILFCRVARSLLEKREMSGYRGMAAGMG